MSGSVLGARDTEVTQGDLFSTPMEPAAWWGRQTRNRQTGRQSGKRIPVRAKGCEGKKAGPRQ